MTIENYTTTLDHDRRQHQIAIADFPVFRCENCGTMVLDDAANQSLSNALRSSAGLLQPSEIRARRAALGLTQKELSDALQISDSTLSRWETGSQIQQRCMDKLLRAFFDLTPLREYFGVTRGNAEPSAQPPFAENAIPQPN